MLDFNTDWDHVKHDLRARIYPESWARFTPGGLVMRRIADGLICVVVRDSPDVISSVHPSQAEVWGRTTDQLLELGHSNLLATSPGLSVAQVPTECGAVFFANDFDPDYGSARILDLEGLRRQLLGDQGLSPSPFGAWVGVPDTQTLVLAEVDPSLGAAQPQMVRKATRWQHERGSDGRPVTDALFRWADGTLARVSEPPGA